jgi:hypothetical protein
LSLSLRTALLGLELTLGFLTLALGVLLSRLELPLGLLSLQLGLSLTVFELAPVPTFVGRWSGSSGRRGRLDA